MLVITQPLIYLLLLLTDAPKCSHTQLIARVAAQKRTAKGWFSCRFAEGWALSSFILLDWKYLI